VRLVLVTLLFGLLTLLAGVLWSDSFRRAWKGVQVALWGEPPAPDDHAHWYTCGMHPWVLLPKPGDCPVCHMKLVPVDPNKLSGEVNISPIMTQDIGVRVAPVTVGPVTRSIRTVGVVDYDETAVRDVNIKIAGWIEKLYVNATGQPVEKGQALFSIYSQELFTTQEEYLRAYKSRARPSATAPDTQGAETDTARWDAELLAAVRKRLEYFDISDEQIKELERSGKSTKTMVLRSPFRGLVVTKNVVEGMKVDPGMQLYRIADLSRVWVMVTLYEHQLPYVQTGQQVVMTLPYIPGPTIKGTVTFVYPVLNQDLRQVKMRVEVDNPDLLLKPGMYANVEIHSKLADGKTLIPREAVIDTGERQVVLVSLGEGRFDVRPVKLNVEADGGMVQVLDGVKQGDMVVVSGQFLLDSEARYRESLAKMVKGTLAAEQKAIVAVGGESQIASLPPEVERAIGEVLDGYFQIGDRLAGDKADGLAEPARKVAAGVDAMVKVAIPSDEHFWHKHAEAGEIRGRALELVAPKDLAAARETYADLSIALGKFLQATGIPPSFAKEVHVLHCPMFREGQGGNIWLQPAGAPRNPFMGSAMLGCFDKRYALPVTGAKTDQGPPKGKP
jgi:RND family efflux transporter MFP subunit